MSDRKRPWLAVGLAFLYPGLGHVYLRDWLRAGAWFALALVTAALVIPDSAIRAADSGGLSAMLAASRNLPVEALGPLFLVRGLNMLDAYLSGRRHNSRVVAGGDRCPTCGHELEMDLDFCPWCTARLGSERDADEEAPLR